MRIIVIGLLVLTAACSSEVTGYDDDNGEDVGTEDTSGQQEDASDSDTASGPPAEDVGGGDTASDAGQPDAEEPDAGEPDAGEPDAGEPTPSDPCEGRTLPDEWMRLTTGPETCRYGDAMSGAYGQWMHDADCSYFEGVYPFTWAEQSGNQRVMGIQPNLNEGRQYIALEIDSADLPADDQGLLDFNIPQAHPLINRRKLVTFSTCPGDFNQEAIEAEMGPGCYLASMVSNFRWGGSDSIDDSNRCGLEPHSTYYINIIHTNSEEGTPIDELEPNPECLEEGCGFRMTPYGNVY